MFHLFNKKKNILGLDISDSSLKFVEFSKGVGGYRIQAFTDEVMPKDIMAADSVKDPQKLITLLKKNISRPKYGKVTTPYVVASIPETKCFVRVIQMTVVSPEEAKEAVPWEAEAYIPIPIGQVYLDWVILPQAADAGQKDKMTVLITAAPRDYVDDYTKILKEAGLRPVALEIESQATARSLVSKAGEAVLILDIDAVRSSFIIFDQNTLEFTSSVPIAGNLFTEGVAKALGIPAEQAETVKRKSGLDESKDNGAVRRALTPILNNLVSEIKNILRFYEEHSNTSKKVSRIMLAGGASKLKHLPSFLLEKLSENPEGLRSLPGIKVELGNPWGKVLQKRQVAPLSREDSLSFATSIGLALREEEE